MAPFADDEPTVPVPTAAQLRWQDSEIGVIFHLDMPVVAGDTTPNNATRRLFDPALYNPRCLDTDQWLAAARAAGARYAIFTATHFNGFMQWQSDLYPYGCRQAAWRGGRGDAVADFVSSCRRHGLAPGLYLSTHRNAYHSVWGHWVDWGAGRGTAKQATFNRIAERMTEELCSRYGDLLQIWFDAGVKLPREGGPDVLPIFAKHQPDALFYNSTERSDHRWIGNEAGHAGDPCRATMPGFEAGPISHNSDTWKRLLYGGDPDGTAWSPGMVDIVLRGRNNHDWFWQPGKEDTIHTVDELLGMYHTSVGRNCNLVIGAVVDPRGLVPDGDARRLGEFGAALRKLYGTPLAKTAGTGREVHLSLPGRRPVDRAVIMEDIAFGERVRGFELHGQVAGDEWRLLARGSGIGHKRIERFAACEVPAVRLTVTTARGTPRIRELAVFEAGSAAP